MAKHQTRRSISISGPTYTRIKEWCQENDRSVSGVVDKLVTGYLNHLEGGPEDSEDDYLEKGWEELTAEIERD